MFSWKVNSGSMIGFDFSSDAPVQSFNCVKPVHKTLMNSVPFSFQRDGSRVPKFKKLFIPMAYAGDPFWRMGCKDAYLNHSYTPFIAMLYAIKTDPKWLAAELSGMIVTEADYCKIKEEFNELYAKLRENRGGGRHGSATEDEFLRLGYLFLILASTCDSSLGLMISPFGEFNNDWSGRDTYAFSAIKVKTLKAWSLKLQDVVFSDLNWKAFYFRNVGNSDEDSFWFLNFPTLDPFTFNHMRETKQDDFFEFVLSYLKTLTSRGIRTMVTIPVSTSRMTDVFTKLDLSPSENYMINKDMVVQSVEVIDSVEPFRLIITNYMPTYTQAFKLRQI